MDLNLEKTPTIIYRVEHRGDRFEYIIADCNQAVLDLFHTTRAKFIGRNILDFIPDPEFQQLASIRGDILQRRMSADELPVVRYQCVRDDGSTFWVDAHTARRIMTMLLYPREE